MMLQLPGPTTLARLMELDRRSGDEFAWLEYGPTDSDVVLTPDLEAPDWPMAAE